MLQLSAHAHTRCSLPAKIIEIWKALSARGIVESSIRQWTIIFKPDVKAHKTAVRNIKPSSSHSDDFHSQTMTHERLTSFKIFSLKLKLFQVSKLWRSNNILMVKKSFYIFSSWFFRVLLIPRSWSEIAHSGGDLDDKIIKLGDQARQYSDKR